MSGTTQPQFSNSAKKSLVKYNIIDSYNDSDEEILEQIKVYVKSDKSNTVSIKSKIEEFFNEQGINGSKKINSTNNYIVKKMKILKKIFDDTKQYNARKVNIITIENFTVNNRLNINSTESLEALEDHIDTILAFKEVSIENSEFINKIIFAILGKRSITDNELKLMNHIVTHIIQNISTEKSLSNINHVVNILNLLYLDKLKNKKKVEIYDTILKNIVLANSVANKNEFVKNIIDFLYDYIGLSLGKLDKNKFVDFRKNLGKSQIPIKTVIQPTVTQSSIKRSKTYVPKTKTSIKKRPIIFKQKKQKQTKTNKNKQKKQKQTKTNKNLKEKIGEVN